MSLLTTDKVRDLVTEEELIARFEDGTLSDFHHRDHVRIVWLYLCRYPLLETLHRFGEALKHFAAGRGKTNLYHETITWSYVLMINERRHRSTNKQSWEEFVEANPDLFAWPNMLLKRYYTDETLRSELARAVFVFPDQRV